MIHATIHSTVFSGIWQMPNGTLVRAPYWSIILRQRGWAVTLGLN